VKFRSFPFGSLVCTSTLGIAAPSTRAPGWLYDQAAKTVAPGSDITLGVNCPSGASVVSGGYHVSGSARAIVVDSNDAYFGNPNGWFVSVRNIDNVARPMVLEVQVHCTT
jgi:hypothetical protein